METQITLKRQIFTEKSTTGALYINGIKECVTLEDTVREVKIPGQTAIPYGEYEVTIDFSNRFGKSMPHVLDVPNFEGIRIHSGNTDKDTEGCILLGTFKGKDKIYNSKIAFLSFMEKLENYLKMGKVFITVSKDGEPLPYSI